MAKEFKMTEQVDIDVRNELVKEKREVQVYHHSARSAHILSYNTSLTRRLHSEDADEYLKISVVSGPGQLENYCVLDFPPFMDINFWSSGEFTFVHSGERTLLRIPPGPPTWEVKIAIPKQLSSCDSVTREHIVVCDADKFPDL